MPVRVIRLKVSDLYDFEGRTPVSNPEPDVITTLAIKQFSFLPKPLTVLVEGDYVTISFPEESAAAQAEAVRLAKRGSQRAREGNYEKAINIFKRVLELMPSLHLARNDLAMAYVETGDVENAVNHLIEVLRLNPQDVSSWVVLANLYIREKHDKTTGEKFIHKALEIAPDHAWALNSLAALHVEGEDFERAIELFEKAIASNPDFANSYYGEAIAFNKSGQPETALSLLERLFGRAKMQDVRSKPVYEGARQMYAKLQGELAERNESEMFKLVQGYKLEMEKLSGYSIRIQEVEFKGTEGAIMQMAWKHKRDYHLLKVRAKYPAPLVCHLESHELTHLKLESEARKIGKNKFFATTPNSCENAYRAIGGEMRKLEKAGFPSLEITNIKWIMVEGLGNFLYNCPLDMVIERHLRNTFKLLQPAQFLSVNLMAQEAWQTNNKPEIRSITPRKILNATVALNGAYGLFLDDFFQGASAFAQPYRLEETFAMSQRLFKHWQERSKHLGTGEEYGLVDEFADMLGLRDWYEWLPDPGRHEATAEPLKEGTTNQSLLRAKHPAAILYFLDALKRFDKMTPDEIQQLTLEIGLVGRSGFDYASPDEKYELKGLPERKFSGLHLMCLMFAGFKRIAPEHDLQMDLEAPFLAALEIYQQKPNGK
jgi:tetratricopeptide (TPR) repeat protein